MKTPYEFSCEWARQRFVSFTVEDLKQAYLMAGGKMEGDGSMWGSVLTGMQRAGLIFKHPTNPFTTVRRPNNKPKPINVWISKEMRLKQQKNALGDKTSLTLNFGTDV